MSKYNNKKTRVHGMDFDSAKEAQRYHELWLRGKCGEISDLRTQVKYELIPAIYEYVDSGEVYLIGTRKGMPKKKKVCVQQAVHYIADFVYIENGKEVVEDVKGYKEGGAYAVFTIKRKLMKHVHGITVREV